MSRHDTCRLCPRLCRDGCPVGSVTESGVPTFLATVLDANERGAIDDALATEALTRCVDCGNCRDHCHLHRPLPEWLRDARKRLLPRPPVAAVGEVAGQGDLVYVQADDRPADWLSAALGAPVAIFRTADRLGVAALDHGDDDHHFAQLRVRLAGRTVLVADGGVAEVLTAAGVPWRWLWEALGDEVGVASCCGTARPPFPCCGARGPLRAHHPELALRVAERFVERAGTEVRDARCREHLRAAGFDATDTLDRRSP